MRALGFVSGLLLGVLIGGAGMAAVLLPIQADLAQEAVRADEARREADERRVMAEQAQEQAEGNARQLLDQRRKLQKELLTLRLKIEDLNRELNKVRR